MAKALRSKSTNIFVWILLLLLIVGLAGFGAGSFGGSFSTVGSVGDEKVTLKTYIRALNNQLNQISQQTGQQFSLEQAQLLGVDRQVLDQVLAIAALDGQVRKAGISVGDNAVKNQLMNTPAFKGLDGKFDEKAYEFALNQADLSPSEYDEILRKENSRMLLQNAVSNGVKSNETYALTLLNFHRQSRSFSWSKINATNLETPAKDPSNADLNAFYLENADSYKIPESKNISYVSLTPTMLFNQIEVNEEDLKQLYEENIDQYVIAEKRSLQRLIFSNEAEASAAYSAHEDGTKTFEQLVSERDLTLADVSLGELSKTDLDEAVADKIFESNALGIYGPYKTDLGPTLYNVQKIIPGSITTFEEAIDTLQTYTKSENAIEIINGMIDEIDDLLASGATIEEVALDTDMTLKLASYYEGNESVGIEESYEFKLEASKISKEDYPTLITLSDGSILAMRLDSIKPSFLQTFETVKEELEKDWINAENNEKLKILSGDIVAKLKSGATFESLGLIEKNNTDVLRGGSNSEIPTALINKIFKLNITEIGQIEDKNSIFIAKLNGITDFDATAPDNKKWIDYLSAQREQQLAQDYLESFLAAIQNKEGVSIDQKSLNAIQASIGSSQ
ncbi:MAG: SurA N-terminal domain-containing protein [Paracoccaceae bacterium]